MVVADIRDDAFIFFFSSRRRHTRYIGDWSSDVCSSDLTAREIIGKMGRLYHRSTKPGGKAPAHEAAKVRTAATSGSQPKPRLLCLLTLPEFLTLGLTMRMALC